MEVVMLGLVGLPVALFVIVALWQGVSRTWSQRRWPKLDGKVEAWSTVRGSEARAGGSQSYWAINVIYSYAVDGRVHTGGWEAQRA